MNKADEVKRLKEMLNAKKLDINAIRYMLKKIDSKEDINKYEYFKALMEPETHSSTKIPSKTGTPSVVFQMRRTHSVYVSSAYSHRLVFKINPFFLIEQDFTDTPAIEYKYNTSSGKQTMYIKLEDIYDSYICKNFKISSISRKNEGIITQYIPPDIYESYRLVSASIQVKYTGPLEQCKGVIGGGIGLEEETNLILGFGLLSNGTRQYSNIQFNDTKSLIEKIRHMIYFRECGCLEGLRMVYFPIDKSYLNFYKVPNPRNIKWNGIVDRMHPFLALDNIYYRRGFNWYVYMDEILDGLNRFSIDIYCNFECTVSPKVLNYMPISVINNYVPDELLNEVYNRIRNNAINKLK